MKKLDAVGGHGAKLQHDGVAYMLVEGDRVYKAFQSSANPEKSATSRGEIENTFYAETQRGDLSLLEFMPKYYGVKEIEGTKYICIQNLVHEMTSPCILDLKMGQQTYAEDATEAKREKELKKYPYQSEIGFRLTGMRTHSFKATREFCLSITPESMQDVLKSFFSGRLDIAKNLTHKLQKLLHILQTEPKYKLYASSLLVIYDSASKSSNCVGKMIDFAHVFKSSSQDTGYIHGLRNLIAYLRNITESLCVGGHGEVCTDASGKILHKTVRDPKKLQCEVDFYGLIQADSLKKIVPTFISSSECSISLENVLFDLGDEINVMDVKLGKRTFDSKMKNQVRKSYITKLKEIKGLSDEIKNRSEIGKKEYMTIRDQSTTSFSHFFRLTGAKTPRILVTQDEARNVSDMAGFVDILKAFCDSPKLRKEYILKLNEIVEILSNSKLLKQYEFIGCSLLLFHSETTAHVRLIDFANCREPYEDNRIIEGVQNLIQTFKSLED